MNALSEVEKPLMKLIDSYKDERETLWKHSNQFKIGRIHSQGVFFQQELAKSLFKNTDYEVLIDFPLSYSLNKHSNALYADIVTIKNKQLHGILEVKIDLGFLNYSSYGITKDMKYLSSNNSFKEKYDNFFNSKQFNYSPVHGISSPYPHETIEIPTSKSIKKGMLLVTEHNHNERVKPFEEAMNDTGFKFIFLLDNDLHPNERPSLDDYNKRASGSHENFVRKLKKRIRQNLKQNEKKIVDFIDYICSVD